MDGLMGEEIGVEKESCTSAEKEEKKEKGGGFEGGRITFFALMCGERDVEGQTKGQTHFLQCARTERVIGSNGREGRDRERDYWF